MTHNHNFGYLMSWFNYIMAISTNKAYQEHDIVCFFFLSISKFSEKASNIFVNVFANTKTSRKYTIQTVIS